MNNFCVHVFLRSVVSQILLFAVDFEHDAAVFEVLQLGMGDTLERDHSLVLEFGCQRGCNTNKVIKLALIQFSVRSVSQSHNPAKSLRIFKELLKYPSRADESIIQELD